MKKLNFLLFGILCISNFAFSQISANFSTYTFYKDKNIQELGDLSKKTVIIELFEYSKREVKKFQKKGTYKKAMENLKQQNETFASIIKENLDFGGPVKTSQEVKEDVYDKSEDYLLIRLRHVTDERQKRNTIYRFGYSILDLKCGKKWLVSYSNTGGNFSNSELSTAINYMGECISAAKNVSS